MAGTTTFGFSGDGGQATLAKLSGPLGLAFDQNNNYYISDSQNKRIRKVTSAGIINTIAGNGASGYAGDMLPPLSCSFYNPLNLWIDSQGNILIVDADRVRKIHTGGPGSLTISLTSP